MNATPMLDFEFALARLSPPGRPRDGENVEALAFLYSRLEDDGVQFSEHEPRKGAGAMESTLSIVVIDDQLAFAEALGIAVSLTEDLAVVGRAPDAASGYDLVTGEQPDLVVCDYRLPGAETGVDCARRLRDAGHAGPILILTGYPAPQVHREVADVPGATIRVLSKNQPVQDIVASFRDALSGEPADDVDTAGAETADAVLSAAELEVLEMINSGQTAAEIATELFLSVHAVRSRIKSTLRKLDSSSQIEAIAKATRMGILVPPG